MVDLRRLTALWKSWDDKPSDASRANALEDEVQRVAPMLDLSGTELRIRISASRRGGLSVDGAVAEVGG